MFWLRTSFFDRTRQIKSDVIYDGVKYTLHRSGQHGPRLRDDSPFSRAGFRGRRARSRIAADHALVNIVVRGAPFLSSPNVGFGSLAPSRFGSVGAITSRQHRR